MIISFSCKHTQRLFEGQFVKKLPTDIQPIAKRKLDIIHVGYSENDLRVPPSNHYEHLKGNLKGYSSIKINDQFRIVFKYENGNAHEVKITDYHT